MSARILITHPGYREWIATLVTPDGATKVVGRATSARKMWALLPKLQREHKASVVDARGVSA